MFYSQRIREEHTKKKKNETKQNKTNKTIKVKRYKKASVMSDENEGLVALGWLSNQPKRNLWTEEIFSKMNVSAKWKLEKRKTVK